MVTLEKALSDHLLGAKAKDVNFEHKYSHFIFSPETTQRPVIRIREGWRLKSPAPDVSDFITVLPAEVRLNARSHTTVSVMTVQETPTYRRGISGGYYGLERLADNDEVFELVKIVAAKSAPPDWKAVQIAVWALTTDINLKSIKKSVYGMTEVGGVTVYRLSGVSRLGKIEALDGALDLLVDGGHDLGRFRIYNEAVEELNLAVDDYLNNRKPSRALTTIAFYHTWTDAYNILNRVFEDYPGLDRRQRTMRKVAFFALAVPSADGHTLKHLEVAAKSEKDPNLKKNMTDQLKRLKKKSS